MSGRVIPYRINQVLFILLPSLFPLLQADAFLHTAVCACIRPCNKNNSSQRLARMYRHTATESR